MTLQKFGWQLLGVTVGSIVFSLAIGRLFNEFGQHLLAAWWAIGLFVVLSVLMFVFGNIAAKGTNKKLFSQLTIFFTLTKLLTSVTSIIIYKFKIQPLDKWFVVPFLMVYIIFTIFETYFMYQLSRMPIKH